MNEQSDENFFICQVNIKRTFVDLVISNLQTGLMRKWKIEPFENFSLKPFVLMYEVVRRQMKTSVLLVLSLSLVALVIHPELARAGEMLNENYKNYFFKDSHRKTYRQIKAVEIHHLQPALKHLASGRPKRAISELKFVLKYVPNHPKALQLMGVVSRLSNQTKIAEQYFSQAIRVFPKYALTHAQFGKFLVDTGRVEDGIEELEMAQSIQPDLKTVFVWLSEAYQKNGNVEKAKMAQERVKELGNKKKNSSKP